MRRLWLALLMILGALLLTGCEGAYTVRLIVSDSHRLAGGEVLDGELALAAGQMTLEEGSRVTGSVYALNGALVVNGRVDGDVSSLGERVVVGPAASIGGNLNAARAPEVAPGARVEGTLNVGSGLADLWNPTLLARSLENRLAWLVPEAVLLALLAYLAARLARRPVARVGRALSDHWAVAAATGALAGLVLPALLVLMAFTIILIPLTVLGILLLLLSVGYGWIAFGTALGRRLPPPAGKELSAARRAFLGTLLFVLVLNLAGLIPMVGGLLQLGAGVVGFGAVLLTRFGLSEFVPASPDPE